MASMRQTRMIARRSFFVVCQRMILIIAAARRYLSRRERCVSQYLTESAASERLQNAIKPDIRIDQPAS